MHCGSARNDTSETDDLRRSSWPGRRRAGCRLRHGPSLEQAPAHRLRPRQRRHARRCGKPRSGGSSPTAGRASGCMRSTCPIRWRATTTPSRSRAAPRRPSTWPSSRPRSRRCCKATGARQVVLVGNSRGGNAIRNYIQNGGGDKTVSHAVLGGTPNHGVWAVQGLPRGQRVRRHRPLPHVAERAQERGRRRGRRAGEVADDPLGQQRQVRPARRPVDRREGHADQRHLRRPGTQGRDQRRDPAHRPSRDLVLAGRLRGHLPLHHRPRARRLPAISRKTRVVLGGKVSGLGLSSTDPASGNFANNLPLPGARLEVFAIDPATGERRGGAGVQQDGGRGRAAGARSRPSRTRATSS